MVILLAAGCGESAWRAEVWSDDGEARASIRQEFTCSNGLYGGSCSEDGEPWLVVDGRTIEVERKPDFYFGEHLYYMRTAGYVLYGLVFEDADADGLSDNDLWYSLVDAGTGEERWNPPWRSLPSPDGTLIAAPSVVEAGDGTYEVAVTFHDALDGTPAEQASLVLPLDRTGLFAMKWIDDDELRMDVGGTVVGVEVGGVLAPAEAPDCWFPSTSSSAWSADGDNAIGDPDEDVNWAGDGEGDLAAGWCPEDP